MQQTLDIQYLTDLFPINFKMHRYPSFSFAMSTYNCEHECQVAKNWHHASYLLLPASRLLHELTQSHTQWRHKCIGIRCSTHSLNKIPLKYNNWIILIRIHMLESSCFFRYCFQCCSHLWTVCKHICMFFRSFAFTLSVFRTPKNTRERANEKACLVSRQC